MNSLSTRQWFSNLSIRRKLVLTFLSITLIPLVLLAYLSNRSTRFALTQAANNALFSVASQTALSIDSLINNNLETIQIEAQLPAFRDFLSIPPEDRDASIQKDQAERVLYDLAEQHLQDPLDQAYLRGFSLVDRSATVILDTHFPPNTANPYLGLDWTNRSYYHQPALLGLPYSSPILISEEEELASIYFSARISNEWNQPVGVLVAHFDSQILQQIISEKNNLAGQGSFGVLFDENLIHLAHGTNPSLIFSAVAQLDENLLLELQRTKRIPAASSTGNTFNSPELEAGLENSTPFFSARDPATGDVINQVAVVRVENYPWQVAFFQPENIFLEPARQQTANILLFSGLIIFLTLGAAFLAAQGLGTPVANLTSIAEQVSAGNLNARAPITSRDEIGALAQAFNTMTGQLQQTLAELEQRVAERTQLLQVSAEIGRAASSILDPDILIHQTVNLITDGFGYYYAAIFLVDESDNWAVLKGATGEAGRILLERGHRLEVGGRSMVGAAISTRQGRIALDVGEEAVRFNNPLLPDTRAEIAVPLLVGDQAIGALDVQSIKEADFSEQDIETLQNMASQVGIAIQNAHLYQQAQTQLEEITRLNKIFLREGWQSLEQVPHSAFQFSDNQVKKIEPQNIPNLEKTITSLKPIFNQEGGDPQATIPIVLQGQIIGVLQLRSKRSSWSEDDKTILDAVTRQAALALENARLVETTQKIAQQEHHINQITSAIRRSTDIESVLKTTLAQLANVLNVQEASIQLSPPSTRINGENGYNTTR